MENRVWVWRCLTGVFVLVFLLGFSLVFVLKLADFFCFLKQFFVFLFPGFSGF